VVLKKVQFALLRKIGEGKLGVEMAKQSVTLTAGGRAGRAPITEHLSTLGQCIGLSVTAGSRMDTSRKHA